MVFLVAGDANADIFASLSHFPREGDDSPLRALGWGSGGAAANVATALALLGARVRLLARVGVDPAAAVALAAATRAGVDLSAVQRDQGAPTGLCFAAVSPGGERTFFSHRGANVALSLSDANALFHGVGWLHLGAHALLSGRQRETAIELLTEASRREIPSSVDLCLPLLRADPAGLRALLPRLTAVFANELEHDALDEGFTRPPLVIVKRGARGSEVHGGGARVVAPAFPIEARDTTGAGDAYVAGFLFAHGRGAPLSVSARLGNALGALTAMRPGAGDALPTLAEARAFLEERAAAEELLCLAPDPPRKDEV